MITCAIVAAEPREDDEGVAVQGNIVVVEWNDDGITGKAHCFRAGLIEEKVVSRLL